MNALTPIEQEVVALAAAIEAINSMVNHEMMSLPPIGGPDAEARFKSLASGALFSVLLADMLEKVDPALLGIEGSLLDALRKISDEPTLSTHEHAAKLHKATIDLIEWLDTEIQVEVWLPSVDVNAHLKLRRRDFVSICGNISKHNVSRLTRKSEQLRRLLAGNGIDIQWGDALGALDDFHAKFHTDVLAYHSTTLAELLNNLRWAIHEYLTPEFHRSYKPPESVDTYKYGYDVPAAISNKYATDRYWDAMNSVRGKPWVPKFTAARYLKGKY